MTLAFWFLLIWLIYGPAICNAVVETLPADPQPTSLWNAITQGDDDADYSAAA